MSVHVPAWKRLGLKLKYANDSPIAAVDHGIEISHKRKQNGKSFLDDQSEPSTKKLRLQNKNFNVDTPQLHSSNTPDREKFSAVNIRSTPKSEDKCKKSVSFTEDTKALDGDTTTTIDQPPGSPGSTPKKPKREKKPKSERASKIRQVPRKSADALDYLDQHYRDQNSWKFNKNREIWILKHVLSTSEIPVSLNRALAGYLHGLKSSGARLRLIQQCQDTLRNKTEEDHATSKQEEKEHVDRLINELGDDNSTNHNDELEKWLENQDRAKIVLWSLGEYDSEANVKIPFVKKKKARTAVVDVSSSSDSESDSDSSEDDSDEGTGSADLTKSHASNVGQDTNGHLRDDTSSSGSSSDTSSESSDSDSESESSSDSN